MKTAEEIFNEVCGDQAINIGRTSAIKAMQEYADQFLKACIDRKRSKIGDLERRIKVCKYQDQIDAYTIALRIHKEDLKWLQKSFITKT